jgi:hypothetical protein
VPGAGEDDRPRAADERSADDADPLAHGSYDGLLVETPSTTPFAATRADAAERASGR